MNSDDIHRRYDEAPCGLVTTTPGGVIVETNETFRRWTGYSRDALEGRAIGTLLDASSALFFETRHNQVLHLQGHVDEVALVIACADGTRLPVLVNSRISPGGEPLIRTAVFGAAERVAYERDLLHARRSAESSETRVRILQDVSGTFGLSVDEQDLVESFIEVTREAFTASDASVMMATDTGEFVLAAGSNPLWGVVSSYDRLRATADAVVVTADDAEEYPELVAGLRAAHLEALSITPLESDHERLGLLVCCFGRRREFDEAFFELQRALARQASQTLVRVRLQRQLEHMALYDQLTGISNRQFVQLKMSTAIEHAQDAGEPMSVVFIDVDDFKSVNDRYGHPAGDAALRELAQRLRDGVRVGDVVGRIGGDEFIAVCSGADVDAALSIAERILDLSRAPIDVGPAVLGISVSIGVAVYRPDSDDRPTPDQMLIRADAAMYSAKDRGKDRVTVEDGAR